MTSIPLDPPLIGSLVAVGVLGVAALAAIGIGVHSYLERAKRRTLALGGAIEDARLRRLEQVVDSIAEEIERVAEGQRYLTRLHAPADHGAAAHETPHETPHETTHETRALPDHRPR